MYYAHSLKGQSKGYWQPLREHLLKVQAEAEARGAKFGTDKAAGLAGLLHDLGKYTRSMSRSACTLAQWIETESAAKLFRREGVAPHAGAWIETFSGH